MEPVPFIRSGAGANPKEGGCIMQVTDWITRGKWTDNPPCVHPLIRSSAIWANDHCNDEQRQELLDLIPRMINTDFISNDDLYSSLNHINIQTKLTEFINEWVPKYSFSNLKVEYFGNNGSQKFNSYVYTNDVKKNPVDLVKQLLDYYDELTGRNVENEPIDFAPVCEVMNA